MKWHPSKIIGSKELLIIAVSLVNYRHTEHLWMEYTQAYASLIRMGGHYGTKQT